MYKLMNGDVWKVEFLDDGMAKISVIDPGNPEYETALASIQADIQTQNTNQQQSPPA
jgi:hypothetical protein